MKRVVAWALTVCMVGICLVGCAKREGLALYILPRELITAQMSDGDILKMARQNGRLALDENSIAGVDWEGQRFRLTAAAVPAVGTVSKESGGSALLKTTDKDIFVLEVGGKLIYWGGFLMGTANPAAEQSLLLVDEGRYTFSLRHSERYQGADQRFNSTLYNFLQKNKLLKSSVSDD